MTTVDASDNESMIRRAEAALWKRYREWSYKIPHVPFRHEWDVRAVPPHGGAMVRYHVRYKDAFVSVYLDCYDRLGWVGSPYWEIHPGETGRDCDCDRFLLDETQELVGGIARSIAAQLDYGEAA